MYTFDVYLIIMCQCLSVLISDWLLNTVLMFLHKSKLTYVRLTSSVYCSQSLWLVSALINTPMISNSHVHSIKNKDNVSPNPSKELRQWNASSVFGFITKPQKIELDCADKQFSAMSLSTNTKPDFAKIWSVKWSWP